MLLKNKNVMVYGAAKSGISAASLLQQVGVFVILYDSNTNLTKDDFRHRLNTESMFLLITGELPDYILPTLDLVVISPGVPLDHPDVIRIINKNIPIWGEIELAYRYTKGKIIGITGTNGKTTTTTLVGKIMKTYYPEVYVVGNIGNSYSDFVLSASENAVFVIELSSFQLETIHSFTPDVSAILNITPDHMDRHHTMEAYIAAKERIAMNQTRESVCILNYEDEHLRSIAHGLRSKVLFFSSRNALKEGLFLEDDDIYYAYEDKTQYICNVKELHLLGTHNYENVMAAVGIAITMGIPLSNIRKALINFKGVEHRIEYVECINGVTYYNDSKGTNPDASMKAIMAMKYPTILIAGGYDKKSSFDSWVASFGDKVKCLIVYGQTKNKIAKTARKHGFHNIIIVENLKEAVRLGAEKANPGDVVLLSPACASWDMFKNFEERGNLFKQYVRELMALEP